MNYRKLIIFLLSVICYYTGAFAIFGERTFFSTRSQSVNAALELVGWEQEVNQPDMTTCYGTVAGAVEYNHSFHTEDISKFLFGSQCLFFSGSKVMNRGPNDILADYFGLPFCYKSCVSFDPVISNTIFDLNWYQGLDCIACGSYLRVHVPLVHTKWDLNLQETVLDNGDDMSLCGTFTFYPAGYMGPDRIERAEMHTNVREAFEGKTGVGDLQPLHFGRIFGREVKTRIAEIQIALGQNYYLSDWYHLGLEIRTAIPTGNRPEAEFLFEPIVGNSHHWELGVGLTSHVDVLQCDCHTWALYLDANVTHLFTDRQNRSYDLKSGPGSRYMTAQVFGNGSTNLFVDDAGTPAEHQYIGCIVPVVNVTTLPTDISIAVQGDIALKLAYQRADGLECDIGYNFWGRSKEESHCRRRLASEQFVLKGDAQVYGFEIAVDEPRVRMSASQSQATLHKAQAQTNFVSGEEFRNENADFPALAFDVDGIPLLQVTLQDAIDLEINQGQINTSNPTVFLSDDDINSCSALLPRAITHKLFFHVGHAWHCAEHLKPYIGIGGFAEWANTNAQHNSGYSQAGIWVKGGFSY